MANIKFGLVLSINGQEIALDPRTAIGDLKEKPIEVSLPPGTEVRISGVGLMDLVDSIVSQFGGDPISWPDATQFPAVIKKPLDYLKSVEVAINDLSITFPAGLSGPPIAYRIGLYVSGNPVTIVPGNTQAVVFKGFSVQITK